MSDIQVGKLGINVEANIDEFKRESGQRLKSAAEQIGREAGQTMGRGINAGLDRSAHDQAQRGVEAGRSHAKAVLEGLKQEFERRDAETKNWLKQGLITEEDAQNIGVDAARAFNAGVESLLKVLPAGTFSGAPGRELFAEIARSVKDVGEQSERASVGTSRLRESLASMAARSAGLPPVFGRLVNVIGSFAVGGAYMVGVLAGLALLGSAWGRLRDSIRTVKEEAERATAVIDALMDRRRNTAVRNLEAGMVEDEERLERLQRRFDERGNAMTPYQRQALLAEINELKIRLRTARDEVSRLVAEGIEENQRAHERARKERLRKDKEMYDESRKLLEQWHTSQMTELERRVELLQKMEAAATKLGQSGAAAEIRAQREELERQLKAYDALKDLVLEPRLVSSVQQRERTMRQQTVRVDPSREIARIQEEMRTVMAALKIAREAGEITEKQLEEGVKRAAQEANKQILRLLETFKVLGVVSDEVLKKIAEALQKTADESENTALKIADSFVAVARGVLSTVDALGLMNDELRRGLQGAIDLAEGIGRIAAGDKIGGVVQTLGGLIGLGSALFGKSQAEKERDALLAQNNQALEQLALEIAGFSVNAETVARAIEAIDHYRAGRGLLGMTDAELDAVAREFGITIRNSSGGIDRHLLDQLREALIMDQQAGGVIAGGIRPQDRLSVSMTVVQGNRLVDLAVAQVDHLRAIREALTGGAAIPQVPQGAAAAGMLGGVTFQPGAVEITVPVSGGVTAANAFEVGEQIGAGFSRRFARELNDAYAAAGRKGSIRIDGRPS